VKKEMIMIKLSDNKGIALITFYLAIALLVTLGIGFITVGIYEGVFTQRFRNSKIAFYLAEAGADIGIAALRADTLYTGTGYATLGEGGYEISVTTPPANPNWRRVFSTGYYPDNNTASYGYTKRDVELYVQVSPSNGGSRWAMFGNSEIDLNGTIYTDSYDSRNGAYDVTSANSNGDIGTNSIQNAALKLNVTGQTATVKGDLIAGNGGDPNTVISINGSVTPSPVTMTALSAAVTLITPQVPSGATNLGNVTLGEGQSLPLNTGDYYLTGLKTTGGRPSAGQWPTIWANGKITLYVDGNIDVKYFNIFPADPKNVTVKVIGDHDVKLQDANVYGALYAPDSEITLKQSQVWGSVVADEITINGASSIHYDEALSTSGDYILGTTVDVLSWREP
jgi:hypothetical protein